MARRHKKKRQKRKAMQARQKASRPSARLAEAQTLATQGDLVGANKLAQDALHAANDDQTIQRARALVAELHFRLACQSTSLKERLNYLEEGGKLAPNDRRFLIWRGLLLMVQQQPDAALKALTNARELAPGDPEIERLIACAQAQADPISMSRLPDDLAVLGIVGLNQTKAKAIDVEAFDEEALATLPGQGPNLWFSLLAMAADPDASRLAALDGDTEARQRSLAEPLLNYYAGVAALRRNDHDTAVAAWALCQAAGLDTPWFGTNRLYLLRQTTEQLATEERWSEIAQLLDQEAVAKTDKALAELFGYAYFHLGKEAAEIEQWPAAARLWRRANGLTPSRHLAQNLALAEESNENWRAAAQAWRDMIRRRPRKTDNPDYMNERQVATLWLRAADCYRKVDDVDEYITCLSKAIEYAPHNLGWRMALVNAYRYEGREEAAENELLRILERAPDHMPALLELADLYDDRWDRDALSIWRKAVAVDGANQTARDGLARALIEEARGGMPTLFGRLIGSQGRAEVKKLTTALDEVPDHPLLLLELGKTLGEQGKKARAQERLRQAGEIAGRKPAENIELLGDIMHELLHVDGDEEVPALMERMRTVDTLSPVYWLDQANQAAHCELDLTWVDRFWQEALDLTQRRPKPVTPAYVLLRIIGDLNDYELDDEPWVQRYIDAIDEIAPNRGLHEYVEALQAREADGDKAVRLVRRAKRKAQKAGEVEMVEYLTMIESVATGSPNALLDALFGNMDPDMIEELLDGFDDDDESDDLFDIFK